MIKTIQNTLKQDREGFVLPKSAQDAIPIRRLWPDGIFQFGSKFSKTIHFSDINYAIASKEDKTSMFLNCSELLNALDTGSTTKLTINNKQFNRQDFEQKILRPRQNDYLNGYRAEYNVMLMDRVTDSSNSVVQERYITLSVHRKNIEEARTFFDRVTADVTTRLSHLDARSEEMDAVERLRVLHDFYRTGEETEFHVDLRDLMRKGHSFKDTIAKPTNADTDARILCYDIRNLGKQLLPVGMLVVLDSVFNRVIRNRALGRNTWVYIDEIYLLFQHEYSANFLFTL